MKYFANFMTVRHQGSKTSITTYATMTNILQGQKAFYKYNAVGLFSINQHDCRFMAQLSSILCVHLLRQVCLAVFSETNSHCFNNILSTRK